MGTPTRGQLLTGRDCLRNGAMNVSSGRTLLRRGIPTMAEAFAAGGYRCGQFGKWHLGDNYPYRPQDRGFHESMFFPSSHVGGVPPWHPAPGSQVSVPLQALPSSQAISVPVQTADEPFGTH